MIVYQDLRLVPAAVLSWALLAALLGQAPVVLTLWAVAVGGVGLALIMGAALITRPWLRSAGFSAMIIGLVLGVGAGHLQVAQNSQVAQFAHTNFYAELTGKIVSEPQPVAANALGQHRFILHTSQVTARGQTTAGTARVLVLVAEHPRDHGIEYGATVTVAGTLKETEPGRGQQARVFTAHPPALVAPPARLTQLSNDLRAGLMQRTEGLSAQARGLVPGAGIGDTSQMQPDLEEAMKTTSLTHITAVSGSHFAIIFTVVVAGLWFCPRWLRAILIAVAMVGFAGLVHPEPSVQRAAVMCAVMVLAMVFGRPSTSITSWAVAILILIVMDPWLTRQYGFVLSVLATGGLILGTAPLARVLHNHKKPRWWLPNGFALVLAVPIAAQLACAPILILLEPHISLYSVPANLLATPALFPATLAAVGATVLGPISPAVADILVHVASGATWWIAQVALFFAGLPGAKLAWWPGWAGAVLLIVVTALGLAAVFKPPRAFASMAEKTLTVLPFGAQQLLAHPPLRLTQLAPRLKTLASIAVLMVAINAVVWLKLPWLGQLAGSSHFGGDWQVAACDVGQGDAFLINLGRGSALMVDTGPSDAPILHCLNQFGVDSIEVLFLSHFHADHTGGVAQLLRNVEVAHIVAPPVGMAGPDGAQVQELTDLMSGYSDLTFTTAGLSGDQGQVSWQLLGPSTALKNSLLVQEAYGAKVLNDSSLVLEVVAGAGDSAVRMIFLGDLELEGQQSLYADLLDQPDPTYDLVKVAHHGSGVQNHQLMAMLAPTVAMVSFGQDNSYGHPHPDTVDLFAGLGTTLWDTARCGSFGMNHTADGWFVVADCP